MIRGQPSHDPREPPTLLLRAREGDPDALQALLQPYWDTVFRLAYRITRHAEDAEDLTQEAFVRIIKRLSGYRGECAFGTWIHRVALNVCLTARAKPRLPTAPLDLAPHADPSPSPEAALLRREDHDRIRDEVLRLRPTQRDAVLLRLFEELSYEEIAEVLDVSLNTARLRAHRGMIHLRKRLGPWLSGENRP